MLLCPMRRALLAFPVLLCACSKPALAPAVVTETRALDAEVLQLVESRVAAVRAAPSDARAHADLGLVYEANGLWDAAEQSFAHALALDDRHTIWLYHRALALREGGQSEAALGALREAARQLPKDPAVQQRLGQWLLDGGDAEGARAAFLKALASRPDQPEFLTGLAGVELAREHWNEALTLAKRAIRGASGYRPARYAAGQALQRLGRTEEAKGQLAAGLNAQVAWCPDELARDCQAYRLTTSALSEEAASAAAEGNCSRAAELYEKLVGRKPEDADLLNNLGAQLIEVDRLERAGEVLHKALALAPQSFAVHLNLSELCLRQKKLPEARSEAARAVELGGTLGRTHFKLARTLVLLNDLEGGYAELEKAVALDARDASMFVALADLAARLGRREQARGWCRKVLELDSNSVSGRGLQGLLALGAGDLDEARAALAVLEKFAPQDERTVLLRSELEQAGR
jgi:protein O-GlcNAc transferase